VGKPHAAKANVSRFCQRWIGTDANLFCTTAEPACQGALILLLMVLINHAGHHGLIGSGVAQQLMDARRAGPPYIHGVFRWGCRRSVGELS
jgi:hypothetical protein